MERERENGEEMERKWRENEEMERKWRYSEEMEKDSLTTLSNFLLISSLFIPFLKQKLVLFCRKMLVKAIWSRMSQKTEHTRLKKKKSVSNSLRESSASCEGLVARMKGTT